MNKLTVRAVAVLCAVSGWLLPSLWLDDREPSLPQLPPPRSASADTKTPSARSGHPRSAMQQFQAVVAGLIGRGHALIESPGEDSGLNSAEAEELALRLAAADLGTNVSDGTAFLRSLKRAAPAVQAAALAAWVEHHPDAALLTLFTPDGIKLASSCDASLLRRLAERDPDKALAVLTSSPSSVTAPGWTAVMGALAQKDAAIALKALDAAPFPLRRVAMNAIVAEVAAKDPMAPLEWAKSLSPALRRLVSNEALFSKWMQTDPAAAATAWAAIDKNGLNSAWSLLWGWSNQDPEAALRWACESGQCRNPESFLLSPLGSLWDQDPQTAIAKLESVRKFAGKDTLRNLAVRWGFSDFSAALSWARGLAKSEERDAAMAGLITPATLISPAERRAFAEEMGLHSPEGFRVLWSLEPSEALRNFAAMSPQMQLNIWDKTSGFLMRDSPAEMPKMIDAMIASGAAPDGKDPSLAGSFYGHVAHAVTAWARQDATAAGAWLASLPPDKWSLTSGSVENLVSSWSRDDITGATAWTQNLPEGPTKDIARSHLAATASLSGDHPGALRWGASIQDAATREKYLGARFNTWSEIDPAAARSALQALPLNPGEKARILTGGR